MGFNDEIIKEFRANHGKVGGNFEGAPLLLLHHKGIKSGKQYVTPLVYLPKDGVSYIFASAAGADEDPQWYRNLLADPATEVEIGDDTVPVTVSEVTGADRDRIYAEQAGLMPGFADYEKKTSRTIPVLELSRA
ncbi:nitroreductase/quinone reductase family protein [Williamsia muralis]|jgi:deazaflavin-dependent oxidoreductase (nitroreductase family)|uniref:Deazaflavin-dependent oxidoreductase (Nitroreductase family) n=1 Tax=Williamsia marianensis TaxID=85044 RepID=A0A315S8T9_WILMA|nr:MULTISPECIES: nitroreductase/quinone reductase family protein [Williamsia]MDV7133562.1 nitroreductase/quinone reductase family protein [Williamsia muralis]PVY30863.1 deazaflavin-dependent oxidoreductase (nitroreductase family) [Williamsia marianensis]RKR97913.1 deazaflavin-dependent oxidoreductase (nitroreductase family) [Williamsia muralis]